MYGVVRQQIRHLSKKDYRFLKKLCHQAKNIRNSFVYNTRQFFKETGKRLSYASNYHLIKKLPCFKKINSGMASDLIRSLDGEMESFFALWKAKQNGSYEGKVRRPGYCPKKGYFNLVINHPQIRKGKLLLPLTQRQRKEFKARKRERIEFNIPPDLDPSTIVQVLIVPKQNARFFEIHYVYQKEEETLPLNRERGMGLDFGVDNFAACATNYGKSFLIDGRGFKSKMDWFDKSWNSLCSCRDLAFSKKKWKKPDKIRLSERMKRLLNKKEHQTNDFVNKAARQVIDFCLQEDIGTLVVGYTPTFQQSPNLGRKNNRHFVSMPYGKMRARLRDLCALYGIVYLEQEESYTSKASFIDGDEIPVFDPARKEKYRFSGKRVHRGLYVTKNGMHVNADINGALNILKKSKAVCFDALYQGRLLEGEVSTPIRIRIA